VERLLAVCAGSALGGGARYLAAVAAAHWLGAGFPVATLGVNLLGSFLIGVAMPVLLASSVVSAEARLFATTGVLGGFTTYSTFSYETLELARGGELGLAALNVAATVLGGLLVGFAGLALGRALVE
jgi:fluoride exporter